MRILLAALATLLFVVVACSDDDGADSPASMTDTPAASGTDAPADGATETRIQAVARLEAESLCPLEFLEACVDSWVATAGTSLPTALCVSVGPDSWFEETPGGIPGEPAEGVRIGDECGQDPSHNVVAFRNYR